MEKPRIGLLTSVIDNRKARGTALLARKLLEELRRFRDQYEFVLIHHEPCNDPLYQEFHEILIPHLPWPFDRQIFREAVFWLRFKETFDIFHYLHPRIWPSYLFTRAKKIVVTGIEGGHMLKINRQGGENLIFRLTSRFLHARMDLIVAASDSGRREIIGSWAVAPSRVITIALGLDPCYEPTAHEEEAQRLSDTYGIVRPYILAVSRFDPHKNILVLIDAFEIFAKEEPGTSLVFVGGRHTSAYSNQVVARIETLERKGMRIVVVPFIEDVDMPAVYRQAVALFYPSRHEGFGLPIIEAMACGTPVVASNASSIPEVAGMSALLADPSDSAGFANNLLSIARSPHVAQELHAAGLKRAQAFSWRKMADETVAQYDRLLTPSLRDSHEPMNHSRL